jgi:hypothetical protein
VAVQIVIGGQETPAFLEEVGPQVNLRDVEAFEVELGYALPADYKEFLLRYNGGGLAEGLVYGRDDQPDVPYRHGEAISTLLSLTPEGASLSKHDRLVTPSVFEAYGTKLPLSAIAIGDDAFGNYFLLCNDNGDWLVRFWVHEEAELDLSEHRIMADGFLDLLMRVRSIEQRDVDEKAEYDAERAAIIKGPLPPKLEREIQVVEPRFPGVLQQVRTGAVALFDAKGHFSLHEDEFSRAYLDLMFWLHQEATENSLIAEELGDIVSGIWFTGGPSNFGLNGFSRKFLESWWRSRLASGDLVPVPAGHRFSQIAVDRILSQAW